MNSGFTFEIKEKIGILSTREATGWRKELNMVSWNGNPPKYDIREWSPNHEQMSKGLTLTEEEMWKVIKLIMGDDKPFN